MRLRAFIGSIDEIVFEFDREGTYLNIWTGNEELLFRPPDELIGRRIAEVLGEDAARPYLEAFGRVLASGQAETLEFPMRLANGNRWFLARISPVRAPDGSSRTVSVLSRDITERKRGEQRLSAQYAVARILAESATLEGAVPELLRAIAESMDWDWGALWILARSASRLFCLSTWHGPKVETGPFDAISRASAFAPGQSLPGKVWQSGAPIWIVDVTTETSFLRASVAARVGLRCGIFFPILLGGETLGVMEFLSRETRQSDEEQLAMLSAVGSQVGQFIERKRAQEAVQQSERRFRALIEGSSDAVVLLDRNGTILYASASLEGVLGYAPEEVVGQGLFDLIHPDHRDAAKERFFRALGNPGEVIAGERLMRHKDGSWRWIDGAARNLLDEPSVQSVVTNLRDVSERKHAEEALRASERRVRDEEELRRREADFRALYNKTPAPQHSLDPDGNIIGVSDYWLELMGYAREEVVGKPFTTFLTPASAEHWRAGWPEFLRVGEQRDEELHLVKRSGEIMEALVSRRLERGPSGAIERTLGVLTDLTARRKAERDRDRLFETSEDLIVIAGFDGTLRDVNPAVERALGYSREQLRGASYMSFIHPDDRAATAMNIEKLITGKQQTRHEVRYRHSDGSWRWTSWRSTAVQEEQLIFAIGRDVTQRRKTEEALRQAQKMEAVGHLTGGIAHDFNNLLTVIIGNLELLRPRVQGQPRLVRLVEAMQHAGERGARLTGQLLAFSRRQTLRPETLDINALIRGFAPLIRRAVGEAVQVELHLAPELWPCTIDPAQLEVALLNVAMNARDAMPTGGRITIETQNLGRDEHPAPREGGAGRGPYVAIIITDTGAGIASDLIGRVFEPFFTTKEVGKGSGLGLSQVYGFVTQSGGHVAIDSEPGRGTAIRIYLPPAKSAEAAPRPAEPRRHSEPARRQERILLVEDDVDVLHTATEMMSELGYEVRSAVGPYQALDILRGDEPIDLLFSDIVMPHMSGVELAHQARRLRPDLKVLLTSGYSRASLSAQSALDESLAVIDKPYKQADLAAHLRVLLDEC